MLAVPPVRARRDEPALVAITVDGKTGRGAVDARGNQVHLLAAATHVESSARPPDAMRQTASKLARPPHRSAHR